MSVSTAPYYQDDTLTLHQGDALEVLARLGPASVNCVVTSPPYFGLRDYGVAGQYGLEPTPAAYVEQLRAVFSEVRRVLADDGTPFSGSGTTGMVASRLGRRYVGIDLSAEYLDLSLRTRLAQPGLLEDEAVR
jgi:DNA modification methylase